MRRTEQLRKLMESEGFQEFEDPGFEAFRKGTQEVRFFWWHNDSVAAKLNVPRASLVVRSRDGNFRIPLVVFPSVDQQVLPWELVAVDILGLIGIQP